MIVTYWNWKMHLTFWKKIYIYIFSTNHTITALEKENEKLRQENQKKDQEYYALKQHAAKIERDMHNSQKEAHR